MLNPHCLLCLVCICKYMDERQNMWTFIMSVVRFARSNTSPIKHSLNNAMLIFPNQKEEKIGGRRRGAVWGGAICKYAALTVQVPNLGPVLWALNILNKTDTLHRVKGNPAPIIFTWTILDDECHMCWRSNIWWNRSQNEAVEPLREEKEEGNWSLVDDHINEQIDQRRTEQIV